MKRLIFVCLILALAAGAQAQYVEGGCYRTDAGITCTNGSTFTLDSGSTFTVDAGATMSCPACTDFATAAIGGGFGDTGCSVTAAGVLSCDGAITSAVLFVGDGLDATGADDLDIGSADVTEVTITTDGGTLDVGTTANSLVYTALTTNTATLVLADAAGASAGAIDVVGAGSIDIGSADVTDVDIVTDGGTFTVGSTANAITLAAAAGQTATLILADDAGAANGAIDVAGAGAITIGSADVTAVTITTDSTADGTDLVLPENAVNGNEAAIPGDNIIFCGENAENGTIFFAPALAPFLGDGSASYALGAAACDALDNADEATADLPITNFGAFKVTGMWCATDATLGAAETITFTLRTAAGATVPSITCQITEALTSCKSTQASTTDIAAGATVAMQVTAVDNNGDGDESWCKVYVQMQ